MRHLRVMFQGGGARVVVLLAAAEALQDIEQNNGVKIVEVAGVSAGSMAAAALAGPSRVEQVRQRLANTGQFFADRQRKGLAKLRRRPSLTSGTTLLMLMDMVSGNPFLSRVALRHVLRSAFPDIARGEPLTFGRTTIPLTVFVSNLREGSSVAINRKNSNEDRVIDAVQRSVSLPFVFSTFETGDETDGGICGNLPISYFGHDDDSDAKILALHFPHEEIEFGDALGYARALLASAMNASVREAVDQTRKYGGVACELPTANIGTFDFVKALELCRDDAKYQALVAKLKPILLKGIDALFGAPPITDMSTKRYQRHPTVRIHEGLRRDFPYVKTLSAQAQIHGDVRPALPSGGLQADKLLMTCKFEPLQRGREIRAIRQGLPFGSISLPLLNLRVSDRDGEDISHVPELLSYPGQDGAISNVALIFLDELVDSARYPIELRIGFEYEALKHLRTKGFDASRSKSLGERPGTQRMWLIATPGHLPLAFTDLARSHTRDVPEEWHGDLSTMRGAWSPGHQLEDKAARTHFRRLFSETVMEDCEIGGWLVPDFKQATYCGFTVTKRN